MPGLALVYLLRAPDDPAVVDVSLNDVPVAPLPAETYTAVSLRPGIQALSTIDASTGTPNPGDKPVLTVSANERRFLSTSVPATGMERAWRAGSFGVAFVAGGGRRLVPIPTLPSLHDAADIHLGQRAWLECNELDAHPCGNALQFKAFKDIGQLFAK